MLNIYRIEFKNAKALNTELLYLIASERARGKELVAFTVDNESDTDAFIRSCSKILKALKKDGYIRLYVFAAELDDNDKMETVYMLNKFPELEKEEKRENIIFVKL